LAIEVVFHHLLAAKEARAAEAWYAAHSTEIAQRFRGAVLAATQRVADGVGTHPLGASRFRYAAVHRFPYRLIYFLETPTLARVVAVFHGRRCPGYWSQRK
jgi:plasmid stabilization system protein ParE